VFFTQVRQLFARFSCTSAASVPDARFEFFKSQVWPRLAQGAAGCLLLAVPNYFDFVLVR
jgi:U3 small nucleolar RNA-associated protein 25